MSDINILWVSSLVFLTNVIIGIYCTHYLYSLLFFMLTVSSLAVHTEDTFWVNLIDKIIIFSIFLYGLYITCTRVKTAKNIFFIVSTFLFCVVVYIFGFFNNCFCFDESSDIAKSYHVCMHIIGSIGHHYIMFL